MSNFMLKRLNLYRVRWFSSAPSLPTNRSLNETSFTVDFLINSCGFTPERAVSVSKHVKFKSANQPNSVLAFFKDQGFTQTQISKVINSLPILLKCNPEKNFLPKIEFLKSKGIPGSEVVDIVAWSPRILGTSLEKRLVPCFNFFSNFLTSETKAKDAFIRLLKFPLPYLEKHAKKNIETLKQAGVPVKNIENLMTRQPNAILTTCDKFQCVVEEVKKMGLDPLKMSFLAAIQALMSMSKSTWDRKIELYMRWGWSENDISSAFKRRPLFMTLSEEKITLGMDFLVNKMGLKSSSLAQRPLILSLSLEKRIAPRAVVYKALVSKGLVKPCDSVLKTIIEYPEKSFSEVITRRHKDEAHHLLKLYKEKLELAESKK